MKIKKLVRNAARSAKHLAEKAFAGAAQTLENNRALLSYRAKEQFMRDKLRALPQKELTAGEIREIDAYWAQYGVRVRDHSSFRWYYGSTGLRDPRFLPLEYYFKMVLPYYNRASFTDAYKDKNAFDTFLSPDCFPKTVVKRISGDFYGPDGQFLCRGPGGEAVLALLMRHRQLIVKNAVDSGQGKNVRKYEISGPEDGERLLAEWSGSQDYLVQEVVRQHPFFAQFNESSVNIMRINSWYHDGQVTISTPVIRFGMPGFATDVCRIDGEEIIRMVGLTDDGFIRDEIVHMNGKREPLSNVVPEPIVQVPAWDRVLELIRRSAAKLPHFHLIGWDVTVDEDERPVVIEYNIAFPGPYPSQMTGGPMWGEHTDELLSFLRDPENQKKYIHRRYRLK